MYHTKPKIKPYARALKDEEVPVGSLIKQYDNMPPKKVTQLVPDYCGIGTIVVFDDAIADEKGNFDYKDYAFIHDLFTNIFRPLIKRPIDNNWSLCAVIEE